MCDLHIHSDHQELPPKGRLLSREILSFYLCFCSPSASLVLVLSSLIKTAMSAMELKTIFMGMNKLHILLIAFTLVNTMSTGFASAARSTTMITASKNINKSHGQLDSGASVTIMNHVGGFITLECSSKDNNLGIHDLLNSQSYYFSFTPNYVGTTLFWCNVMWQQRTAHVVVWSGPGFLQVDPVPCMHCLWDLKPNGFYRSEAGGPFTFVQGWQYPAH